MKTNLLYSPFVAAVAGLLGATGLGAETFLKNPSFESNFNDVWPHYSAIDEWFGGSGVNQEDGPFHNPGTAIPDQLRAAFMQGAASLSQDVTGLTAGKTYWIQFQYDARACCGGTIDLTTKWNDVELDKVINVKPVVPGEDGKPYYSRTVIFVPDSDSGTLTFSTLNVGDATVNLDGITIVQRDKDDADPTKNEVPVQNPSFEASGITLDTGILSPAGIGGWTGSGNYGINASGSGAFANNGAAPDQDNVAVLQGTSSLSQLVQGLVVGGTYNLTVAYNARTGNTPHIQVKAGDAVLFEENVTAVGGSNPYRSKTTSFKATDAIALITIAQTVDGDQALLVDDIHLRGATGVKFDPITFAPGAAELSPGRRAAFTAVVDADAVVIKAIDIKLRIPNAAVATLVGADPDGILTLHYDQGGVNVKSFEVVAVGRGVARVDVTDDANLGVANDVSVNVGTSFVQNPSFESTPAPGGVGYGPILGWTGGSGLNKAEGPFHDNGIIPDRNQIAFLQNSAALSQQIVGLASGQNYWLQFRYNVRACCGGTMGLAVKFDGKELFKVDDIQPVGPETPYYFQNASFVPAQSSGLLEFVGTAVGDATLLLDAVDIVQRDAGDVVIENPSFEATGNPVGVGYLGPALVAGWEITGGYGINITGVGPFTDNGAAPDQDRVLFMQGSGSASQNITGLTSGQVYTLIFSVNSRNCCGAGTMSYTATFNDEPLVEEELLPIGGTEPYLEKYLVFTATSTEGILVFNSAPTEGDHTLLLDNIRIVAGGVQEPVRLRVEPGDPGTLRIFWRATAAGFVLQSASVLPTGWANVAEPVVVDGDFNVVTVPVGPNTVFYRLKK